MPAIPVRQRRNLAPLAVGTPGIDNADAQAVGAIADAGASIAKDERAEEAAQGKILNKHRTAAGLVRADRFVGQFQTDLIKIKQESRSIEEYNARSEEARAKYLDQMEDPDVVSRFTKDSSNFLTQDRKSMGAVETGRLQEQIVTDIVEAHEEAIERTSQLFRGELDNPAELFNIPGTGVIDSFLSTVETERAKLQNNIDDGVLTHKKAKELGDNLMRHMTEAAALSIVDYHPDRLEEFLTSPGVDAMFSDKEVDEFRETATAHSKRMLADAKVALEAKQFENHSGFIDRALAGNYDPEKTIREGELTGDITKTEGNSVRALKRLARHQFTGDNFQTQERLSSSFARLGVGELEGKGKALSKRIQHTITFAQASQFRQEVLESMENEGGTSRATGEKWLKRIDPKFYAGLDRITDKSRFFTWQTEATEGASVKLRSFTTPDGMAEARAMFEGFFMDRIDKAGNEASEDGISLNQAQVQDIADEAWEEYKVATNPTYQKWALGSKIDDGEGAMIKIIGYDTDGEALISYDLDAETHEAALYNSAFLRYKESGRTKEGNKKIKEIRGN
jgi:hypothetical protein